MRHRRLWLFLIFLAVTICFIGLGPSQLRSWLGAQMGRSEPGQARTGSESPADEVTPAGSKTGSTDPLQAKTGSQLLDDPTMPAMVRGVVVYQGHPYPDANVVLKEIHEPEKPNATPFKQTSNEQGAFVFEDVPPGQYQLVASDGNLLSFADRQHLPVLQVLPGSQVGPVTLPLQEAQLLRVTVLAKANAQPIPHALVQVAELGISANTDEQGQVELALSPELWTLQAEALGFAQSRKLVSMSGPGEREVLFRLEPGTQLSGVVRVRGGAELPGVEVILQGENSYSRVLSDAKGRYLFKGVPIEGRFILTAGKTGFSSYLNADFWMKTGPEVTQDIWLEADKPGEGILEGNIRDTQGHPIPQAQLSLERLDIQTQSDEAGFYRFTGLTAQPFETQLLASAPGFATQGAYVKLQDPLSRHDFVMEPGVSLEGRVQDSDGVGLEGATLHPYEPSGHDFRQLITRSNADGFFQLAALSAQSAVAVTMPGYESHDFSLSQHPERPLIIVLREGRDLQGQVIDRDTQKPIPTFEVQIKSNAADPSYTKGPISFESPDGRFKIPRIGQGEQPIELSIASEGYQAAFFDVPANDVTEQVFPLSSGGQQISGRILNREGQGLANASVQFKALSGVKLERQYLMRSENVLTDREGRFNFNQVPHNASYFLSVSCEGYAATAFDNLERRPAEELQDLSLVLAAQASIEGIVNLALYPTASAVRLHCARALAILDAEGRFRIDRLEASESCNLVLNKGQTYEALLVKPITLREGEVTHVRIGFEGEFQVAGRVTVGGQIPTKGVLFLAPESGGNVRRTTLDGGGHFAWERVPGGTYGLLFHQNPPANLSGFELSNYPGLIRLQVDQDINRDFDFPGAGTLSGQIVTPTPGWSVRVSNSFTSYEQPTAADGRFSFPNVLPDTYRLIAYRLERSAQTLIPELTMPEGDLDLGLLEVSDQGRLLVRDLSQPHKDLWLEVKVFSTPQAPIWTTATFLSTNEVTFKNMPEGQVTVHISSTDATQFVAPHQVEVVLDSQTIPEVGIQSRTVTCLQFSTPARIANARLELVGQNKRLAFQPIQGISLTDLPLGAYILSHSGLARDVPEGLWRLRVVLEDGQILTREVELKVGVNVGLRLDGP